MTLLFISTADLCGTRPYARLTVAFSAQGAVSVCIFLGVFMALWAMRNSFSSSPSGGYCGVLLLSICSAHIFFCGDRLKVLRIDAAPHAAKVVYLESIRDGSSKYLVRQAVSESVSYASIPARASSASPEPAPAVWFGGNSSKNLFPNRAGVFHRDILPQERKS